MPFVAAPVRRTTAACKTQTSTVGYEKHPEQAGLLEKCAAHAQWPHAGAGISAPTDAPSCRHSYSASWGTLPVPQLPASRQWPLIFVGQLQLKA